MTAEELVARLRAYGADVDGALERFMDDAELYEDCIDSFLNDSHFEMLRKALEEKDGEQAFFAAHALKGVASNLGLTPLLGTVCEIVEPLRNGGGCEELAAGYADVAARLDELKRALYD